MTTLNSIGLVILGLVIGGCASLLMSGQSFGGVYNQVNATFREGIKVGTSDQFAIDQDGDVTTGFDVDGDTTVSGGTLTLTHSNTATSSAIIGCVQSYATSTATPVRMEFSTTTALATFSGGIIPNGVVAWRYGTCPLL